MGRAYSMAEARSSRVSSVAMRWEIWMSRYDLSLWQRIPSHYTTNLTAPTLVGRMEFESEAG